MSTGRELPGAVAPAGALRIPFEPGRSKLVFPEIEAEALLLA
jgi:hypothetical protein